MGPELPNQLWKLSIAAVSVSTGTNVPTAKLYLDTISPGSMIGGTYSGNNDSTDLSVTLRWGQTLIAAWEGGDAGALATLSVYGEVEVR